MTVLLLLLFFEKLKTSKKNERRRERDRGGSHCGAAADDRRKKEREREREREEEEAMSFLDVTTTQRGYLKREGEDDDDGVGKSRSNTLVNGLRENQVEDVREECERAVFQLTTRVSNYKRFVDMLGTKKDTETHREKLRQLGEQVGVLAKKTTANLKELKVNKGKKGKTEQAKLLKDFQSVLTEFQKAQRLCHERKRLSMPVKTPVKSRRGGGANRRTLGREGGEGGGDQQVPLLNAQLQEQIEIEGEMEQNHVLLEEREQDIKEIQLQIGEVTEIFQDLAVLVSEQGEVVEDIEANIVSTYEKTSAAKSELKKAARHQKSTRYSLCIIFFMCILGVVILMLVMNVFGSN